MDIQISKEYAVKSIINDYGEEVGKQIGDQIEGESISLKKLCELLDSHSSSNPRMPINARTNSKTPDGNFTIFEP